MFSLLLKRFVELLERVTSYSPLLYQEDISASKQVYAVFYRQIFIRDIKQLFLAITIFSVLILASSPLFSFEVRFLIYISICIAAHLSLLVIVTFFQKLLDRWIVLVAVTAISIMTYLSYFGNLQSLYILHARIDFAVHGVFVFVILVYCQGSFLLSFFSWTTISLAFISFIISKLFQLSFPFGNIILQVSYFCIMHSDSLSSFVSVKHLCSIYMYDVLK